MCTECWSIVRVAASEAEAALQAALKYLNTEAGQRGRTGPRIQVEASKNTLTSVFTRRQPEGPRRALEKDLFELERGLRGIQVMTEAHDPRMNSYRDFAADQLNLERAIQQVRDIWQSNPTQHP
jgi:hypothetical protein